MYPNFGLKVELRSVLHNACVTNGAEKLDQLAKPNIFSLSSASSVSQSGQAYCFRCTKVTLISKPRHLLVCRKTLLPSILISMEEVKNWYAGRHSLVWRKTGEDREDRNPANCADRFLNFLVPFIFQRFLSNQTIDLAARFSKLEQKALKFD